MQEKDFEKVIELLQKEEEISNLLTENLQYFTDGHAVWSGSRHLNKAIFILLKEIFGNEGVDYIEWWLYEGLSNEDKVVWIDTQEFNLSTPKDLFNFITHYCK